MAITSALVEPDRRLSTAGRMARCQCGSTEFTVIYKAPVHVRVAEGRVLGAIVAADCHEGAIVAECERCGRSDVDGEDAGCIEAREAADAATPWAILPSGGHGGANRD